MKYVKMMRGRTIFIKFAQPLRCVLQQFTQYTVFLSQRRDAGTYLQDL